jgi:hypothetical protein
MNNMFQETEEKIFYLWLAPSFLSQHNYKIGSFISSDFSPAEGDDHLMFLPNPKFSKWISPFQAGLLNSYLAEYNLELSRRYFYKNYPNRLTAIFLFDSEEEAIKYQKRNPEHVGKRTLVKCKPYGKCLFSKHDSSWIDFLRLGGSLDEEAIHNVCKSYWGGVCVKDCKLFHFGKEWSEDPIFEVLLYGRIDFIKENEEIKIVEESLK